MAINWDTATAAEKTHEMNMLDPSYTENYYASGPTTDYVYPTGGVAGPPAPYTPSQQAADQQTKATSISQGTYWDEKNPAPNTKSTKNTKSTNTNTSGGETEALKSLGYVNKNSFKKETGYSSVEQYLADQRKKEQARVADQRKKEQAQAAERQQKAGQIGRAWDPILAELDAQIGRMPGQQAEYQNQLGGLADLQLQDVEQSANTASTSLEAEKKKGLRSLEEDMRNQMDAAGRYIGGLGGGNSSAGMQASEAVTRAGQKARGGLLETVTAKLGEIQTIAQKARSDVQNWKAGKLFEITQFFAEKMNELSMQKANSKGEKAKAIEQLKFDIEKELAGTLRDLDNQVIGYATTLEQWERERSAQLEDYARTQLGTVGSGRTDISNSLKIFNDLISAGYSADDAKAWMDAQGVYTLPDANVSESDEFDATFGSGGTPMNISPQVNPIEAAFSDLNLG